MSSLVTAPERSVIGKITRSGLDTRKSRPPASTIVASDVAMSEFYVSDAERAPAALRCSPDLPDSTQSSVAAWKRSGLGRLTRKASASRAAAMTAA